MDLAMPTMAILGGSVGSGELLVLFAVVLILFGPHRLPEVARWIGRVTSLLRKAADAFHHEMMRLDIEAITGPDPADSSRDADSKREDKPDGPTSDTPAG